MSCHCDYSIINHTPCISCINSGSNQTITQKRIWKQVRTSSSNYLMNLSALTSAANRLASYSNVNWQQMSDRNLAAIQPDMHSTRGNSLRSTLTSSKPGAGNPGGTGVDVKHDSYARYLNRKKAAHLKTQTTTIATMPVFGNKTNMNGLLANSINCCV